MALYACQYLQLLEGSSANILQYSLYYSLQCPSVSISELQNALIHYSFFLTTQLRSLNDSNKDKTCQHLSSSFKKAHAHLRRHQFIRKTTVGEKEILSPTSPLVLSYMYNNVYSLSEAQVVIFLSLWFRNTPSVRDQVIAF